MQDHEKDAKQSNHTKVIITIIVAVVILIGIVLLTTLASPESTIVPSHEDFRRMHEQ